MGARNRWGRGEVLVARGLVLSLFAVGACAAPGTPTGPGAPAGNPITSASAAAPAPTARSMDEKLSLHLRQPQVGAGGLRVTLVSFTIEDVAADPGSGEPGFGVLIAQVELSVGGKTETVEIISPVRLSPAKPVLFGAYRVSFVSSASEYSKDPIIVVRVERSGSAP